MTLSITAERDTYEVPSNGMYRRFEPGATITWTIEQPDAPTLTIIAPVGVDPILAILEGRVRAL